MTIAEKILWQELRNNRLGVKFRRQMPLVFGNCHYVADFYCAQKKLIIEIDGGVHNQRGIKEYDRAREEVLKSAGYQIMRFSNQEVKHNLRKVIEIIKVVNH